MLEPHGSLGKHVPSSSFALLLMDRSTITYIRVGVEVARILVPKILKVAIPVALALFAYSYT